MKDFVLLFNPDILTRLQNFDLHHEISSLTSKVHQLSKFQFWFIKIQLETKNRRKKSHNFLSSSVVSLTLLCFIQSNTVFPPGGWGAAPPAPPPSVSCRVTCWFKHIVYRRPLIFPPLSSPPHPPHPPLTFLLLSELLTSLVCAAEANSRDKGMGGWWRRWWWWRWRKVGGATEMVQ